MVIIAKEKNQAEKRKRGLSVGIEILDRIARGAQDRRENKTFQHAVKTPQAEDHGARPAVWSMCLGISQEVNKAGVRGARRKEEVNEVRNMRESRRCGIS